MLGGFEERKPIGIGKCGWKAVESKRQWRSSGWASVASRALLPIESPMRALCSRHHLAATYCHRFLGLGSLHRHRFGSDDFEPVAPDLTTWPILPKDRLGRKGILRLGKRQRWDELWGRRKLLV